MQRKEEPQGVALALPEQPQARRLRAACGPRGRSPRGLFSDVALRRRGLARATGASGRCRQHEPSVGGGERALSGGVLGGRELRASVTQQGAPARLYEQSADSPRPVGPTAHRRRPPLSRRCTYLTVLEEVAIRYSTNYHLSKYVKSSITRQPPICSSCFNIIILK